MMTNHNDRPLVTVVLAVRNEERYINNAARSLLKQETPDFDLEVLVIDGQSTDRTREIVRHLSKEDNRVRLLSNEQRNTPSAFNIGLKAARGEYVCIFGAHAEYAPNYISVCLQELRRTGAVGCSGVLRTVPGGHTLQAKAIAWALGHKLGSSSRSARTQAVGFVNSIPFPLFRRDVLLGLGGYDETLHRNQDNDMNQRLRSAGHRLYLTADTYASYCSRPNIGELSRYAYKSGYWNYVSLLRNPASMSLHHFVPALFVIALTALCGLAMLAYRYPSQSAFLLTPLAAVLTAYLLVTLVAGVQIAARYRSLAGLLIPGILLCFHCSYGAGTAIAFLTGAQVPASKVQAIQTSNAGSQEG